MCTNIWPHLDFDETAVLHQFTDAVLLDWIRRTGSGGTPAGKIFCIWFLSSSAVIVAASCRRHTTNSSVLIWMAAGCFWCNFIAVHRRVLQRAINHT